jgi:hypothetical protein
MKSNLTQHQALKFLQTKAMATVKQATVADLYKEPGKAEIVEGRIVRSMPTGFLPNNAASEICMSLRVYAKSKKYGHALCDGGGYIVDLPNCKSLSPDAAFYLEGVLEISQHKKALTNG